MKKIFTILFLVLTIISIGIISFADMGAPIISPYEVYVSNINGAKYTYYDKEQKEAILPYETKITINFEYEDNGVLYGSFDAENNRNGTIKLEDVTVLEKIKNSDNVDFSKEIGIKILKEKGLEIYNGPSKVYSKTKVKIPVNTELKAYREKEQYSDNPWFYVTYNGTSGWVCELDGSIGYKSEWFDKIMIPKQMDIYSDITRTKKVGTVPANTIITNFLEVDAWSHSYYINYNNISGFVSKYEIAVQHEESETTVNYKNAKLYSEADLNSNPVTSEIPIDTKLKYNWSDDVRATGWMYASYNNTKGWYYYVESTEYLENYEQEEDTNRLEEFFRDERFSNTIGKYEEKANTIDSFIQLLEENQSSQNFIKNEIKENVVLNQSEKNDGKENDSGNIIIISMFFAVSIMIAGLGLILFKNKQIDIQEENRPENENIEKNEENKE